MDDINNQPQQVQDAPVSSKQGSWLRRILLSVLLLFAVLACAFFWFTYNARSNPPYSTALELIQNDARLIEYLGKPIQNVRWLPSGNYPTQFQIQVKGPQGMADVSVTAGEFDGKWEITALDARVFDPERPHETAKTFSIDIGSSDGDAPVWPPAGASPESGGGVIPGLAPPGGVDIELPSSGPPGVEVELPSSGPPGVEVELPAAPPMNIEQPSVPPAPKS